MNKILKLKKVIIAILTVLVAISIIGGSVDAVTHSIVDTTKKASLKITKFEHANGSDKNAPLAGVEFTVYLIPSDIETVGEAEEYIKNNEVTSYTKTTPSHGTVTFSDLELGRYLVAETDAPKNVVTKIESFLIDLPRTRDDGSGWDYDVTVYPKNITIYGKVTLTHNNLEGEPLAGNTWKLEKLSENGEWKSYTSVETLTTNSNGQITIENLEKGDYRLVQNSTVEEYIMDQSNTVDFTIDEKNINYNLTTTSEKLSIQKYVKLSDGNYGKEIGAFTTDTISWKTIADVATIISKVDEYSIIETIQSGLDFEEDSLHVYGEREDGQQIELASTDYAVTNQSRKVIIKFDTSKLQDYKNVVITYDTVFDYYNIKSGEFETGASLKYTNSIDINGNCNGEFITDEEKAKVNTGAVLIYKSDVNGNPLKGAQFKIATSKENAENGIFVKDLNNTHVVVTSDVNGYVLFGGLKYSEDGQNAEEAETSYWLIETNAPSYEENGEKKYYNLLDKPVEVKVNNTSEKYSEDSTTVIINKKGFTLPLTGGSLSLVSSILGIIIIFSSIIIIKKSKKKKEVKD